MLVRRATAHPALASITGAIDDGLARLERSIEGIDDRLGDDVVDLDAHDSPAAALARWARTWRSAVLTIDPSAASAIRVAPRGRASLAELVASARDLLEFLESDEVAGQLRSSAMIELGSKFDDVERQFRTEGASEAEGPRDLAVAVAAQAIDVASRTIQLAADFLERTELERGERDTEIPMNHRDTERAPRPRGPVSRA